MTRKKKVIVGMSGGVDSSVSALLLKEAGYEVVGLFMKNWEDDGVCPAPIDAEDVASVCHKIGIPFYTVNFVEEYQKHVFSHFLKESVAGRTPNPDVLCNREIKFKAFFDRAMELGADFLATGHYARVAIEGNHAHLLKGSDPGKDQSYFLALIKARVLHSTLFPIGHLLKTKVREIALNAGLSTAQKKDSTGICFIGKRDFKEFLSTHLKAKKGLFKKLSGEIVGEHDGLPFYTIGQRKGLGIGGEGEAWFVIEKELSTNTVFIERGENHPALFSSFLIADELSFIDEGYFLNAPFECMAKIRYRQEDQACTVIPVSEGRLEVRFKEPQRAVTPGQTIVFYDGERCLGGATIKEREKNF